MRHETITMSQSRWNFSVVILANAPRTFARPELVRSRLKSHALLSLSSNTGLPLTYLHTAVECKSFLIWYHALELFSSCEISFQAIGKYCGVVRATKAARERLGAAVVFVLEDPIQQPTWALQVSNKLTLITSVPKDATSDKAGSKPIRLGNDR